MHEHGPDELFGPVRGTPAWWQGMAAAPASEDDQPPPPKKPRKKRKDAQPMRQDLVDRVRAEIAAGTYDTPEKWEAALDCLLGHLHGDD